MSWYCVEERNGSVEDFGRIQRRFLYKEDFPIEEPINTEIPKSVSFYIFINLTFSTFFIV